MAWKYLVYIDPTTEKIIESEELLTTSKKYKDLEKKLSRSGIKFHKVKCNSRGHNKPIDDPRPTNYIYSDVDGQITVNPSNIAPRRLKRIIKRLQDKGISLVKHFYSKTENPCDKGEIKNPRVALSSLCRT